MGFTHFDEKGKAIMVDVTEKQDTVREATATGKITVNKEVFRAVKEGTAGKGDVRLHHGRQHRRELRRAARPEVRHHEKICHGP